MQPIHVGVIGSGFMGAAHVDALRRVPGVTIAAISSIDLPRAREIADHFGIEHVYDDWRELLDHPEITVVHNCTPNNLHFEVNRALVEAGKHVFSEKPLTLTSEESSTLVRLAAEKGVVTGINFNYRGYPLVQQARGTVARGELGDPRLVHGHYLQDWLLYETDYNWRIDSEISGASRAIADIGSHWCDLVQFVTGRRITSVFASLFRIHETRAKPRAEFESFKAKEAAISDDYDVVPIDTEDGGTVLLRFEDGMRGSLTVSQVSAGRKNRQWFEIDGTERALWWDQEQPNSLWIGNRDEPNQLIIKDPALLDANARTYAHYPGGHPEGYPDGPRNLFLNYYEYIRDGKRPGSDPENFPTFADGHAEVQMVEAVLESNRRETWVDLG